MSKDKYTWATIEYNSGRLSTRNPDEFTHRDLELLQSHSYMAHLDRLDPDNMHTEEWDKFYEQIERLP